MITIKQLLQGHRLYDEIWTIYGPFYYGYEALLYRITGAEVSHNAVRLFSIVPWIVVPLLCAWITFRATGSYGLTAVTHLATSLNLAFFVSEPGTPQEICILLLTLLAAALQHTGWTRWRASAAGLLVAALALSKINIGAFAFLASALTLVMSARAGVFRNAILAALISGSLAMPAVLMRPKLDRHWALLWCLVATATILTCIAACLKASRGGKTGMRECSAAALALTVGIAAIVTPFLIHGSSLRGISFMLIARVANFGREFSVPMAFNATSIVSASASLLVCIFYVFGVDFRLKSGLILVMKLLVGAASIFAALTGQTGFLLKDVSPWIWLLVASSGSMPSGVVPRVGLCLLTALQTLYAYPVAGSQLRFTSILIAVGGVICLGDVLAYARQWSIREGADARLWRAVAWAACLFVLCGHIYNLRQARSYYLSLQPLDLPGATLLHVTPPEHDTYHWIVRRIQANCDAFIPMPGPYSLYFWAKQDSPTLITDSAWVSFLNDREQQRMIGDFARIQRSCVVYSPAWSSFWMNGRSDRPRPLARWIFDNFRPLGEFGGYSFLVRK